jgi:hypothetical protein
VAGLVHLRHPIDLGGAYFCFNAVTSQLSVFVSAFTYWQYYAPPTAAGDMLGAVLNATAGANHKTLTNSIAANLTVGKIELITLVASVGTLFALWAFAALGLWLTMKPEYRRTFSSTQTGYAYARSIFLDNEGTDAKRIYIFGINERLWRVIRDRVRQWVLNLYAVWQALKPVWFTDAVKAQIPDDFLPAEALRQENARAPGGRRETLGNASRLRSMSIALGVDTLRSESDASIAAPSPQPIGGK